MTPELATITDYLDQRTDITAAYVFGSVASGLQRPDSDLDLAIATGKPLTSDERQGLMEALAVLTGRPIDLVELGSVGEPLLGEILHHGRRLKGDDEQHARLMTRHVFDTEDFQPYVRRMLEERRRSWMEP